jgi:general stress protein 26
MWHVWRRGRIYLVTRSEAVKTTNIATNPSVVVTHPDPMNPIIIEGWAIEAPHMRDALQPLFQQKYDWNIATDAPYDTVIEITPTRLLAWGEQGAGSWSGADIVAQEPATHETGTRHE